jgi:hypothetical protein
VVGDEERAIVDALRHRFIYVFNTGGIGPTHADITADCVARRSVCRSTAIPRARHPARMGEDDRCRDERGAPAHDTYSQGGGSHPLTGCQGALASGSALQSCRRCSMRCRPSSRPAFVALGNGARGRARGDIGTQLGELARGQFRSRDRQLSVLRSAARGQHVAPAMQQ